MPVPLCPIRVSTAAAAAVVALLFLASPSAGQHEHHSPYADSGSERVKTLTEEEVTQLLEGAGMGLARPAELNGYPGPRHVLELADALELTPEQREETREVFESMQAEAVALGTRIVSMEEELDRAFARGAGAPGLEYLVSDIARLHGELRWVHLRAHLALKQLLTESQIAEYARLRGYHPPS